MRLHFLVREGDYAMAWRASAGREVVRRMIDSQAFRGDGAREQRWGEIDSTLLAATCTVDAPDGASVREVVDLALAEGRRSGWTNVEGEAGRYRVPGSGGHGAEPVLDVDVAVPATGRRLRHDTPLARAGVSDGDLLCLRIERPPTCRHRLLSAPDPRRLFAGLQLAERTRTAADLRGDVAPHLLGVLLYTDADHELATFVRTHFDELGALSGDSMTIFVAERPTSWSRAKRYWKSRLPPELYRSMAALQWLSWVPYERHMVPEIARDLGVPVAEIPCLVLFGSLRGERFVFPVAEASPKYLRNLLQTLAEVLGEGPGTFDLRTAYDRTADEARPERSPRDRRSPVEDEATAERTALAEKRLRAELANPAGRPAAPGTGATDAIRGHQVRVVVNQPGATTGGRFTFHGKTTFIHQPVDTAISDFQDGHGALQNAGDLARLLELVLTSHDLDTDEKEEVVDLVHAAAEDVAAGQPAATRSKLSAITALVSRAADIATPALGAVGKVAEAFGAVGRREAPWPVRDRALPG